VRWSVCALCVLWACTNDVDPPGETVIEDEPGPYPLDDLLRFHHLQAKGTHNSYHVQTASLPEWAYTHAALDVQLEAQGVRQFELDVYWDDTLGAHTVQHVPLIDPGTTCATFVDCVATLDGWSSAHPGHHPLLVLVETKDLFDEDGPARLDALDQELLAGLPPERLLTPAEVQGAHPDLRTALATDGWPTLGALRGRTLFVLHDGGERRDTYVQELQDRPMFPDAMGDLDLPFAAVHTMNEPADPGIAAVVAAGHLVRTRADDNPATAEAEGAARLQLALDSGAHFVSTDFPAPVEGVSYSMEIPDGTPSRCNPATAPAECTSLAVEDPAKL
jgi:hypothetical protein